MLLRQTERQAWGNLPVPPLSSACTWNMKVLFPKDQRGKNEKPHPVAFQLAGKQKPDLHFCASIADWGAKRKRDPEKQHPGSLELCFITTFSSATVAGISSALTARARTQNPCLPCAPAQSETECKK